MFDGHQFLTPKSAVLKSSEDWFTRCAVSEDWMECRNSNDAVKPIRFINKHVNDLFFFPETPTLVDRHSCHEELWRPKELAWKTFQWPFQDPDIQPPKTSSWCKACVWEQMKGSLCYTLCMCTVPVNCDGDWSSINLPYKWHILPPKPKPTLTGCDASITQIPIKFMCIPVSLCFIQKWQSTARSAASQVTRQVGPNDSRDVRIAMVDEKTKRWAAAVFFLWLFFLETLGFSI